MAYRITPEPGFWIAYDMDYNIFSSASSQTRFDGALKIEDEIRRFYKDQFSKPHVRSEWGQFVIEVQPPDGDRVRFRLEYVPESEIKNVASHIRRKRRELGF